MLPLFEQLAIVVAVETVMLLPAQGSVGGGGVLSFEQETKLADINSAVNAKTIIDNFFDIQVVLHCYRKKLSEGCFIPKKIENSF